MIEVAPKSFAVYGVGIVHRLSERTVNVGPYEDFMQLIPARRAGAANRPFHTAYRSAPGAEAYWVLCPLH